LFALIATEKADMKKLRSVSPLGSPIFSLVEQTIPASFLSLADELIG